MKLQSLIILFYVLSNVIIFLVTFSTGNYGGGVGYKTVLVHDALLIDFLMGCLLPLMLIPAFQRVLSNIKFGHVLNVNLNNIDLFYLLCLLLNFITVAMGIGVAGTTTTGIGFLQNIFPLVPATIIYVTVVANNINRDRIILITIGVLLTVAKGWTGNLVTLTLLVLLIKSDGKKVGFKNIIKLFVFGCLFIISYYYIYGLKYYIRSGNFYLVEADAYLYYVFGRVAHFSLYSYLNQNVHEFSNIISENFNFIFFIQEYFLGFMPKAMLGITDYRSLDNLYSIYFINADLVTSGFSITFPGLFVLSMNIYPNGVGIFTFLLFCLIIFLYQMYILKILGVHSNKSFIFITMLLFVMTGNLKEVALYNYTLTLLVLFLLFLKHLIPIKKLR